MSRHFALKKQIGNGSYGVVMIGEDQETKELVAIKRVNKSKINQNQYLVQAFEKEIDIMKKLNCKYIVKFIDLIQSANNYNVVMELCDGDLDGVLRARQYGYRPDELRKILLQLNEAFALMYQHHIMHRDLKLQNIFIKFTNPERTEFDVKLGDFGFSKEVQEDVTQTKLGTPITMAPEVIQGKPYTSKADLWSLGVIIYQLLFKDFPFKERSDKLILNKILSHPKLLTTSDPNLQNLINRLLEIDPKSRISWEEYFKHPFFEGSNPAINIKLPDNVNINELKNYEIISQFNTGIQSNDYQCFICLESSTKKKIFMKVYSNEFVEKNHFQFDKEILLFKLFKNNKNSIHYIKHFSEGGKTYVIFDMEEGEILDIYLINNTLSEEDIKKMNQDLLYNILYYSIQNKMSFDIISLYNFLINRTTKKVMLFDCGLCRRLLNPKVIQNYFIYKEEETNINEKSNVLNYGVTLFICYYKVNVKLTDKIIELPHKPISGAFSNFLSRCLKKNQKKRYSWNNCLFDNFVKINKEAVLLTSERLKMIFESYLFRYRALIQFYEEMDCNIQENAVNNKYAKSLLELIFLELNSIIRFINGILGANGTITFKSEQEITLFKIFTNGKYEALNLNLEMLSRSSSVLSKDPETKNVLNQNLLSFKKLWIPIIRLLRNKFGLDKFCKIEQLPDFVSSIGVAFNGSEIANYFSQCIAKGLAFQEAKNMALAHKYMVIGQIIEEYIIAIRLATLNKIENVVDANKVMDYFEDRDCVSKLCVATIQLNKPSNQYIFFSFLSGMFRFNLRKDFEDEKEKEINARKTNTLEQLIQFYPNCAQIIINSKPKQ